MELMLIAFTLFVASRALGDLHVYALDGHEKQRRDAVTLAIIGVIVSLVAFATGYVRWLTWMFGD